MIMCAVMKAAVHSNFRIDPGHHRGDAGRSGHLTVFACFHRGKRLAVRDAHVKGQSLLSRRSRKEDTDMPMAAGAFVAFSFTFSSTRMCAVAAAAIHSNLVIRRITKAGYSAHPTCAMFVARAGDIDYGLTRSVLRRR